MAWLVIGASGQLGRSISHVLHTRDLEFIRWNRKDSSVSLENFVLTYVNQFEPEVIINCAAWTDVDGAETNEPAAKLINVDAVEYIATSAKSCGAILVHVSTDYVFSGVGNSPWREDGIKQPISAYGRTKAQGEDLVTKIYPDRSYIFRTAWLYSAFGKNFVKTMVRVALKDEAEISVVADQIGQPTFAGDLATQIVDSIQKNIPFGIYHGTNSGQASWFEFAQEIFRLIGEDPSRVKPIGSSAFPQTAKRPTYSVLGHSNWAGSEVDTMENWQIALARAMPEIVSAIKAEG